MKHPKLVYGFIAVIGFSFLFMGFAVSIILEFTQWPSTLVPPCLLLGASLLTVGVCGIERQRPCFYRIGYRFLAVLGVIWLMSFLAVFYLDSVDAISFLEPLYPTKLNWLIPYQLSGFVLFGIVICGVLFFTVGLVGIVGGYFRNQEEFYTAGAAFVISILIFGTVFASFELMTSPVVFRLRDEITQVEVISNNPLIISLGVKAITCRDSWIYGVSILDFNGIMVGEYRLDMERMLPVCILSGGSSVTLTLRFNSTLPSGNYTIFPWSGGFGGDSHGHASLTIP